ncbi:Exosome component Rrp46 [Mycena indigotica]|uniref:Exosome component Rrp46 n=1 Tax=Mycena indigotica TaxID=2126181 RepID=A0A8H6VYV3_9AGAR|nr:Exosome component Rrp46 [Mycena indigotica]KAF7296881.1 Exosome component Rrp46 [Mycena indigotica]
MSYARRGRRKHTEPRTLSSNLEGLTRVDGSARFAFGPSSTGIAIFKFPHIFSSLGESSTLASISGPIEVRIAAEQPSTATFEVSHRPLSGIPGTQSKALSANVRAALLPALILTQNPRTLIQLVIQSLTPTKSRLSDTLVAASVNASTLALLDAGSVPMRAIVCAVAIGRLTNDKTLLVDPDSEEEPHLDASGCFAFAFGRGPDDARCVWANWRSMSGGAGYDEEEVAEAKEMARVAAKKVWRHVKEVFGEGDDDGSDGMEI